MAQLKLNMTTTTLYIKNMVCPRCIMAVKDVFGKLGLDIVNIKLGEVIISNDRENINYEQLKAELEQLGFELLEDSKAKIIEKIKTLIIDMVHYAKDETPKINLSEYISREIGKDYNYLSNMFSDLENITIEKFIILQKIEKVKELLIYGELTLSEIAFQLNYSSTAHISKQFKQVTGFTPSEFRKLKQRNRRTLDNMV